MMSTTKKIMLLVVLISSCSSEIQDNDFAQVKSTTSPVPTVTGVPTSTPLPTVTQSLADEIFIIPTRKPYEEVTPTPLATPASSFMTMKLKDMSKDELTNLLYDLQERSYNYLAPFDGWWPEGQFVSSQEAVGLIIQEYLYHYPDDLEAERLRWQLAFIDSIGFEDLKGNEYYDAWMLEQLQVKLNQGDVLPHELEGILDEYWFDIDYYQPIENLFGDGKVGWFYVIRPQVWEEEENYSKSLDNFFRGGLFVVVRLNDDGRYELYLLENALSFSGGSSSVFSISDHNKNNITEISLSIVYHGGTICTGDFRIFEWRENAFVDLTGGNIKISDCVDNYEYVLVDGKPAIRFRKFFTPIPSVYVWDGDYYGFSGYEHTTPVEKWLAATLSPGKSYPDEAKAIEEILSSDNVAGLSSAHIDFLRYRLGIVYALNSEVSQARAVLQDLADNPLDKARTIYSDFAQNFLKYYFGDSSLYLACQKSREIFDDVGKSSVGKNEVDVFGFPSDFTFGAGMLRCFDGDVFELLVAKMPIAVENVYDELRKNGVKIYYADIQDVNFDGLSEEWVMITEDGVYVVFPNGQYYRSINVDYFWYIEDTSKYIKTTVSVEKWNGIQEPVLTISTGQELSISRIDKDYTSVWLNTEYDMEEVILSPHREPAQFQVFYTKPFAKDDSYYGLPWNGYRWDSTRNEFRDDLIEYTLFVEHDPDAAVEISRLVLPLLNDWMNVNAENWYLPRYFYLCGLSYELSGNVKEATKIYWQLWHDFPESQYAFLAKYKLEPINP